MKRMCAVVFVYTFLLWGADIVEAYDQPAVNMGLTSFLDGMPPDGPGLYLEEYIVYYQSDRFNDKDGHEMSLPDPDLGLMAIVSQIVFVSESKPFLGAHWGLDIIVPLFDMDMTYDVSGTAPMDNGAGLGDILIGPFLQWDPVTLGKTGPVLLQRFELSFIFPTGKYDDDREINPGSNFYSFNPYWAGTVFFTPKLTATTRINYLWNSKNNDPGRIYGNADDTRAGQAIHTNFAFAYEVLPRTLRVGLNGYYFKQITDSRVGGSHVSGKEEVLGLGPGMFYMFAKQNKDLLFFNAYFETKVKNRTKGERFLLRYVHKF